MTIFTEHLSSLTNIYCTGDISYTFDPAERGGLGDYVTTTDLNVSTTQGSNELLADLIQMFTDCLIVSSVTEPYLGTTGDLLSFGFTDYNNNLPTDTIQNRFTINPWRTNNTSGSGTANASVRLRNDAGTVIVPVGNVKSTTDGDINCNAVGDGTTKPIYAAATVTNRSVSLFLFSKGTAQNNYKQGFAFYYAGILQSRQEENGYYGNAIIMASSQQAGSNTEYSSSVNGRYGTSTTNIDNQVFIKHIRIDNSTPSLVTDYGNFPLTTGNPFITQSRRGQRVCPFWLYQSDTILRRVGYAPNLLSAQGVYPVGLPIRLAGAGGIYSNGLSENQDLCPGIYGNISTWIPVGKFGGRTILARCHSSYWL